jgi:DNA repair protein RadC
MKIREISWNNKPCISLKRKDVSVLSDAELLAIVLNRSNKLKNAIEQSNKILGCYNFNKLSLLSIYELKKVLKNNGNAMKIQALFEISKRTNRLKNNGFKTKIKTAVDIYRYFVDELMIKNRESFYSLFLDNKNRIIGNELISVGKLNESIIYPHEVFSPAIKACANSIILVHNYPNGKCEISRADREIRKIINESGNILGIYMIDYLIIGENNFKSVKE